MFTTELLERRKYLQKVLMQLEENQMKFPEGRLRIAHKNGNPFYYRVDDNSNKNGKYIRKSEFEIAKALAQKDYNDELYDSIIREISAIDQYLHRTSKLKPEAIYDNLNISRQSLVHPFLISDEEYARKWQEVEYPKSAFEPGEPEYYTGKKERVRSKSEIIIADTLASLGIPYRYEYPLYDRLNGTITPDFQVLHVRRRVEMYLEHFGLMDKEKYLQSFFWKQNVYPSYGLIPSVNFFMIFEDNKNPINTKNLRMLFRAWFL